MNLLPDEIIILILSFVQIPKTVLNSIPFVCKKWQSLCKKSITGKLDFSICKKFDLEVTDELVYKLRSRFKYIDTFRLEYDILQDSTLIDLTKCPKLYKLSLSYTDVNSSILTTIMKNKNIKKLNLHSCTQIKTSFLTSNCNLEYLNLSMTNINDVLIENIANYCLELKYLNVSFCRRITNESFLKLLDRCKKLNSLIITGCSGLDFDSSNFKNISKIHYLGTKIK